MGNNQEQAGTSEQQFTFTVEHRPQCIVALHVDVKPELTQKAYEEAVKIVNKQVSFSGFRKGKAPRELVIKNYSRNIEDEWKQALANMLFPILEKAANIPVLKQDAKIQYDMKECSLEHGAKMTFSFETVPTIPTVDPKKFHLEAVKRPAVTDKEIDETIRQIQFYFAEWKPVTDRPAQEGDFVILNIDIVEPPSKLFEYTRFEVTPHSMAKWMRDLVIGLEIGKSIEGTSTPDPELPEEEKAAFVPKQARVHLVSIEEAVLPTLDDKYYRNLGVANADDLRTYVTRLLNEKADAHVREAERGQAVNFLLNDNPFDLPNSYIVNEARFRMRQMMADESFNNYWGRLPEAEQQQYINAIMEQSKKAVRLFYLCNRIVKDANITIKPEDLPQPPSNFLEALILPQDEQSSREGNVRQAEAYARLTLEKAQDHIIAEAKAHPREK